MAGAAVVCVTVVWGAVVVVGAVAAAGAGVVVVAVAGLVVAELV